MARTGKKQLLEETGLLGWPSGHHSTNCNFYILRMSQCPFSVSPASSLLPKVPPQMIMAAVIKLNTLILNIYLKYKI